MVLWDLAELGEVLNRPYDIEVLLEHLRHGLNLLHRAEVVVDLVLVVVKSLVNEFLSIHG